MKQKMTLKQSEIDSQKEINKHLRNQIETLKKEVDVYKNISSSSEIAVNYLEKENTELNIKIKTYKDLIKYLIINDLH